MPTHHLADMTWDAVHQMDRSVVTALLPVGAVEAHGPHLPLGTDVIIAQAMAAACGRALESRGRDALVLPPLWYTSAGFAEAFPGTVSVRAETVTSLVRDVARSLGGQGFGMLALCNAHLDPGHLASLRMVSREDDLGLPVILVDLTRRRVAERLTDEFRTGACHAGRFEGSIVQAEAPHLFREDVARRLDPNPASLSEAIQAGHSSFEEAGGPDAYFGWPADATAEEGHKTVEVLGLLLAEAVVDAWEVRR